MDSLRIPLRIVFYREEGAWIAHCLEFDLIGDGDTREEALRMLSEAIRLQVAASVEHKNPANLFSPADGKYFRMFAAGKHVATAELTLHVEPTDDVRIEDVELREFAEPAPAAV